MIPVKLLTLRSLYTWNLFHTQAFTPTPKAPVWTCGMNPILLRVWMECKSFMTRIFDPCWFQSTFTRLPGREFSTRAVPLRFFVHSLSVLKLLQIPSTPPSPTPTACVCIRKLALPDYVNLLERPFSINAKCPCISVISRRTVCALAIYRGIARTCELFVISRRESFSDMFTSTIVLLNNGFTCAIRRHGYLCRRND